LITGKELLTPSPHHVSAQKLEFDLSVNSSDGYSVFGSGLFSDEVILGAEYGLFGLSAAYGCSERAPLS